MALVKLVIASGVVIGKVSRCGVLVAWFIGSTVAEVIGKVSRYKALVAWEIEQIGGRA